MFAIKERQGTFTQALSIGLLVLFLVFSQGCELKESIAKAEQPLIKIANLNPEIQGIYKKIQENNKENIKELQKKSDSGNTDAAKLLGLIYLEGKFVKRDISHGIDEFKKSANSGDKESATILYKIYTSKKYKETHQLEAQEYGEKAGILTEKIYSAAKTIEKLKQDIERNQWDEFIDKRNERPNGFGSAVAINRNGHFLTNRHVVEGCRKVVVRYNNMLGRVTSVSLGQEADVAVVKVNGLTPAYLQFMSKKAELGEKIYVGGYPLIEKLGADLKITDGLVSGVSSERSTMIQITASISSGNSGGPVVDEKNRIVAIATGAFSGRGGNTVIGHGINFATHSEAILKFLRENQIAYETKDKGQSVTSREVAEFLKISTGLVVCIE